MKMISSNEKPRPFYGARASARFNDLIALNGEAA